MGVGRRDTTEQVALLFLILETQNDYVRFHGAFPVILFRTRVTRLISSVSIRALDIPFARLYPPYQPPHPLPTFPTRDHHPCFGWRSRIYRV